MRVQSSFGFQQDDGPGFRASPARTRYDRGGWIRHFPRGASVTFSARFDSLIAHRGVLRNAGLALFQVAVCGVFAGAAGAATFYVDNQNSAATDGGPGTLAQPYRTITAAVTQRGAPGNTIEVRPGVYREQVSVPVSGLQGSRFVVRASGPGVVIEGAESFATLGQWTRLSGNVWRAAGVTWPPQQVIADGKRLLSSIGTPDALPAGSFVYVAGTGLCVNVGGDNPGAHGTLVGRYAYGFSVPGRSWVTIAGFAIRHSDTKGIFVSGVTTNVELLENSIANARLSGIHLSGGSAHTIASNTVFENGDHGIYVTGGVTGSVIRDNESYRNARITVRAANGIHIFGSPGNRLERNRSHENEDSGFQINSASNDMVLVNNRSWNNGDHGFDHLNSTGATHVHNVSSFNLKDGFSFEGGSQNARVYNCISVNNGISTNSSDFFVDATSQPFVSDYNLFWNMSATPPVRIGSTVYSTVGDYATATGRDVHSIQANPGFVNLPGGDFHLLASSPAIDAATSAAPSWPALDADGHTRFDVLTVTNKGAGTITFADIGSFEFSTPTGNQPPVAALVVQPASGSAPLAVVANAAGSSDPEGGGLSYTFDFGDGQSVGPQAAATAPHTYGAGSWTARVIVTDNVGLTSVATARVDVSGIPGDLPPVVVAPALVTIDEAQVVTVTITASDPDSQAIQSLTANLSGLPQGNGAQFVANASRTGGTLTWRPTFADSGLYTVTFQASNALVGTAVTTIRVVNVDRPPLVTAPNNLQYGPGSLATFIVLASDPDGDPISSLTADFSRLPSNSGAQFVVVPTNISGVFTWLIGTQTTGNFKATFVASNVLSGSATTNLHVRAKSGTGGGQGGGTASDEAEADIALPAVLSLSNGRPNPGVGPVDFALDLPRASVVHWSVFDLQGRSVWSEERSIGAGHASLRWSGTTARGERVGKGLYFVRVRVDQAEFTRRIVRL